MRWIVVTAAAFGVPALVGLSIIPPLLRWLGTSGFGYLALAWALISYFSLLDFGLGRSFTRYAAHHLQNSYDVSSLFRTALSTVAVIGALACSIALAAATLFKSGLGDSAYSVVVAAALSIPGSLMSAICRAKLEAQHQFVLSSALRCLAQVAVLLAPVAAAYIWRDLQLALYSAPLAVSAAAIAHVASVVGGTRILAAFGPLNISALVPLLRDGAWMTVSTVIGPLMTYLDRFVLGALGSSVAVALYAVPYELTTRVGIISGAISTVMYPLFATKSRTSQLQQLQAAKALLLTTLVLVPVLSGFILVGPTLLSTLLGRDAGAESVQVLRLLSFGVFLNGLAQVPFVMLQANGRADITARVHLLELPVYAVGVVYLTAAYGPVGTAAAWTIRVVADTAILLGCVNRSVSRNPLVNGNTAASLIIGGTALLLPLTNGYSILTAVGASAVTAASVWNAVKRLPSIQMSATSQL